jgi:hypothetical protein
MTREEQRKKRKGLPREKTPDQRRQYIQNMARVDATATAELGLGSASQMMESTISTPSTETDLEAPIVSATKRTVSRPLMAGWPAYITAGATVLGIVAAAVLYIASMKTDIATNATMLKNLEKSQDSLREMLRSEITRIEVSFEKKLATAITYLRGSDKESKRQGAEGSR